MKEVQDVQLAWFDASRVLGIEVTIPFECEGISYPGLIHNFGNKNGTVFFVQDISGAVPLDEAWKNFDKESYFKSLLNYQSYKIFNKKHFQETLLDWGWFGQEKCVPSWFKEMLPRQGHQTES